MMRLVGMLVVVCGVVAQTACESTCTDPNGCGALGQTCANWPANDCQPGLRCIDDTCVACGGANEVCCWTAVGPDECPKTPGSVCDETGDGPGTCSEKCGIIGAECCGGNSCPDPAGATCNGATGMCEAISTPAACGTGPLHFVELVDDAGCARGEVPFSSNTPDECIAVILEEHPGWTAGPVDTLPPSCDQRCQYWDSMPGPATGADPIEACAFSATALEACFASMCTDCLYTDEPENTCGNMY